MNSVNLIKHPLAGNCLKTMRSRETKIKEFRSAMDTLGLLLAFEATKGLSSVSDKVMTPLEEAECSFVDDSRILLVPVLRAGLGLVDSFLKYLPSARISHVGMYRDHETLEARPYLNNTPEFNDNYDHVFVLDPMLATGNSGVKALEFITAKGYSPENITFVCVLSAEQGISQIKSKFPEVDVITAAIDPKLNENAYIVPGLGDAGDRLYLL